MPSGSARRNRRGRLRTKALPLVRGPVPSAHWASGPMDAMCHDQEGSSAPQREGRRGVQPKGPDSAQERRFGGPPWCATLTRALGGDPTICILAGSRRRPPHNKCEKHIAALYTVERKTLYWRGVRVGDV